MDSLLCGFLFQGVHGLDFREASRGGKIATSVMLTDGGWLDVSRVVHLEMFTFFYTKNDISPWNV